MQINAQITYMNLGPDSFWGFFYASADSNIAGFYGVNAVNALSAGKSLIFSRDMSKPYLN